jgi:hypothetical protein
MAAIEGFLPVRDLGAPATVAGEAAEEGRAKLTSVKDLAVQKLAKQQLFKGGIANSHLLLASDGHAPPTVGAGAPKPRAASALNYHDLILEELKGQQDALAVQHARLLLPRPPVEASPQEEAGSLSRGAGPSAREGAHGGPGLEECRPRAHFLPSPELWSRAVRDLLAVERVGEPSVASQSPPEGGATESRRARGAFRLLPSRLLDQVYAKIRELVQYPIVVRQRFFLPSARKHQHEWADLEKLMVVALLFHSQSLHLARKFAETRVPNLKSSGGVFQYGSGLRAGLASDESHFLIDQLKLIGHQLNDLLMWLILRVQGEMDAQASIQSAFEVA